VVFKQRHDLAARSEHPCGAQRCRSASAREWKENHVGKIHTKCCGVGKTVVVRNQDLYIMDVDLVL
jgi:hypothetical protein